MTDNYYYQTLETKWIRLTAYLYDRNSRGNELWITTDIESIEARNGKSVIIMNSGRIYDVYETPAEIIKRIGAE